MKKIVLLITIILISCSCDRAVLTNNNLSFSKNSFEYGDFVYLKDIVDNIDVEYENILIDTSKLGDNSMMISYKLNNESHKERFTYLVEDTTEPLIWISGSHTITVGYEGDIAKDILCADNADRTPNCYIEGKYDVNAPGSYKLKYVAVDASGNKEEADFVLHVREKSTGSSSSSSNSKRTELSDIIENHKNDKTQIGVDVSRWQGEIDWEKVKNDGIEFAIIRLGYQKGFNEDYELDPYYLDNIKGALANDIKVGIYFYSYATSIDEAIEQANYVLDNIKDYNVTLPIAFDWENFSYWNGLELNLLDIKLITNAFQDTIKKAGFTPVHYGSKYYLRAFWNPVKYDTWLAHYINETDYEESYVMWQLCDNGIVDGINGPVDLDIFYLD